MLHLAISMYAIVADGQTCRTALMNSRKRFKSFIRLIICQRRFAGRGFRCFWRERIAFSVFHVNSGSRRWTGVKIRFTPSRWSACMISCSVETRQDLLRLLPQGLRIAELGVFAGDFAQELLEICRPSELHLIDRWTGQIECGDQNGQHIRVARGEDLWMTTQQ